MAKEIVIKDDKSVASFITKAIEMNAPIETLERLFALHKEVQAEQARAAYTQALAKFQKECPEIKKNKIVKNKDGQSVRYKFASLDSITMQIKDVVAKNGLAYTWDVIKKDNNMSVTCTITHVLGHKEQSTFEIPITPSDFMTQPQTYASAQTFAKRYTLMNALGIATAEEDTDATDVKQQKNAKSPKAKIVIALKRLGYATDDVVVIKETIMKLTQLELVEKNYEEIVARLNVAITEKEEHDHENS